jgi:hypothetical protein
MHQEMLEKQEADRAAYFQRGTSTMSQQGLSTAGFVVLF